MAVEESVAAVPHVSKLHCGEGDEKGWAFVFDRMIKATTTTARKKWQDFVDCIVPILYLLHLSGPGNEAMISFRYLC